MKRCPQCDFVYEDDQSLCDMDGSELFHAAQTLPLPPLESVATEPASIALGPASQPVKTKRTSFAVTAIAAVVLMTVLFMVYYAVTHRSRGNSNRSVARATTTQLPTPEVLPSPSLAELPLPDPSTSPDLVPSSSTEKPPTPARLTSSPVSAAGGGGRGPVVIRLTNGASIKADEAWETREGTWYRQGSVVTLLKPGRVRAIEQPAHPRSAAAKPEAKKAAPESPNANKESKISSILKTTGRILKKPFKL